MKVNFNLFKNQFKKQDNHPDYNMSVFNKETSQSTRVGACWIKSSPKGTYLSCQYDDEPYQPKGEQSEASKQFDALTPKAEYPKEEIKPDDIPF